MQASSLLQLTKMDFQSFPFTLKEKQSPVVMNSLTNICIVHALNDIHFFF